MNIVKYPNKILDTPTCKVDIFDKKLSSVTKEMFSVMDRENGVGLAANQVGLSMSVFVVDVPIVKGMRFKRVFVNPELTLGDKDIALKEGCLSFPGELIEVPRKSTCKVTYQNLFGTRCAEDINHPLVSIVLQHEMDHLLGKTFLQYKK